MGETWPACSHSLRAAPNWCEATCTPRFKRCCLQRSFFQITRQIGRQMKHVVGVCDVVLRFIAYGWRHDLVGGSRQMICQGADVGSKKLETH